jgi:C4-dicarboxylate-specific signal transduction histidine kinase
VDGIELQQVVLNLSINAVEAMSAVTDRPRLLETRTDRNGADSIRVTGRDAGVALEAASAYIRCVLHDETRGIGYGACDQPFYH